MINDPTTRDNAMAEYVRRRLAGEDPPVPQSTRAPGDPVDRDARLVEFVREKFAEQGIDEWGCPIAPTAQPEAEDELSDDDWQGAWDMLTAATRKAVTAGDDRAVALYRLVAEHLAAGATAEEVLAEARAAGIDIEEADEEDEEEGETE
jgi:hypothetical protein